MYDKFYGARVTFDGDTVVIDTDDVPDHGSPYFPANDSRYVAPPPGMVKNPGQILAQDLTLRVSLHPAVASPSDTNLGPIGVAVNGVVFFNQYAAGFQPLDDEIRTFDQYNGHPAPPMGIYHYHVEPVWLTKDPSALIGVLLDGFPVYGPLDANGSTPTDLDVCHGHTSATPDFPGGIYHYHVGSAPPYISGCFRGQPGTVLN
jgi:YHYH protein